MSERGTDWSQLPPELLEKIAGHLPEIPDLFRFRSVCSSWRSTAASKSATSNLTPWIHLKGNIEKETSESKRRFFSLSENRIYTLPTPSSPLYETSKWMFASSSGGGGQVIIYTIDFAAGTIRLSLVNPITRSSSPLPPLLQVDDCVPIRSKVFAPADIVATMYSTLPSYNPAIFFCRPGEPAWQKIDGESAWLEIYSRLRHFGGDFAYHDGCFYVLGSTKDRTYTSVFDMQTLQKVTEIQFPSVLHGPPCEHYLVESSTGKLLLVLKNADSEFELFQLDASEQQMKWIALSSIGNDVLFVDDAQAMCVDASYFKGCRGNCIYFLGYPRSGATGDRRWKTYGVRLFDVREGQVEEALSFTDNSHTCWLSSWFVPSLS